MIYLPYSALFFSFIAAINWQLRGNGGRGGKYSCWVFVTSETEEMLVCVTVICLVSYISCHYVTGLFCFCFLHIQNHLDSMQVFSSYFSSKFSLPVWLIGVVPVTSFSCPVNYCSYPWSICKHLINIFDLYRHRSKYWTVLGETIKLHSHFIHTWQKLFMCFINV